MRCPTPCSGCLGALLPFDISFWLKVLLRLPWLNFLLGLILKILSLSVRALRVTRPGSVKPIAYPMLDRHCRVAVACPHRRC